MLLDPGLGREFGRIHGEKKGEGKWIQMGAHMFRLGLEVSVFTLTKPERASQGTCEQGITGGFGWTCLLSGSPCLSSPTGDHWTRWTSQMEVPGDKRFPISHLATKDPRQLAPDRFTRQRNLSGYSYTEFRGSWAMTITRRFWSTLSLVFMIHLLQHYLKGSVQPCLRINRGNIRSRSLFHNNVNILQVGVVSLEKIPWSFAEPAGRSCKIIQMPRFYGSAHSPDATERYS